MDCERDKALEEAARWIEHPGLIDMLGIIAEDDRQREDAQLRMETRIEMRKEIAETIRSMKARRDDDVVEVLRRLNNLGDAPHDLHLREAWSLSSEGLVEIVATIKLMASGMAPQSDYRIYLTDKGQAMLAPPATSPD